MIFVVSPHLDDAVLSLGQFIAHEAGNGSETRVVTVCAGIPARDYGVSTFDDKCGFMSSRDAVSSRRDEDAAACRSLGALPIHLDFLDGQYVERRLPGEDRLISASIEHMVGPDHLLFAPLGLVHPDHRLVGECARQAGRRAGARTFLYEELPARVLWPELVPDALDAVAADGFAVQQWVPAAGDRDMKVEAMDCYVSQRGAFDPPTWLVPERCWELSS